MEKAFKQTSIRITLAAVSLALIGSLVSGMAVYTLAQQRLNRYISVEEISQLTASNSEVSQYLQSQKAYHAHFESIALAIRDQERREIATTLPWILAATILASGLVGWGLARRILQPVRESYIAQQRFMQDAAHELRNPLAAIRTIVQQAISNPPSKEKLIKVLNSLDKQAAHLSDITTDLLLLERKESPGKMKVNLSELLIDILEDLHSLKTAHKVKIVMELPSDVSAEIDPQHFVHIAKNIIENAIKFSLPHQTVVISLATVKESWLMTVEDNGIGIPKAEVSAIRRRFYRAKNAAHIDGTGLGMAIIYKYVKLYGGDLRVESQPNKGTIVTVKI